MTKENFISGVKLPSGEITPGRRSKRTLRRRNAIVANSLQLAGKRVLDVGCADGLHSLYMARHAEEVWGVDHRASEIAKGQATADLLGVKNIRLQAGDIRDPDLFEGYGKFDLAVAWGFLHRIGDIFALLYTLEGLADAVSLEWRTPMVPNLSKVSIAYHPPGTKALDPMNAGGTKPDAKIVDKDKIEGDTAFWEPTPGAVIAIMRRLGFVHSTVLGYNENFESERRATQKATTRLADRVKKGKASAEELPRARVHMLFEKTAGSIKIGNLADGDKLLPEWDDALIQSLNP